MATTFIEPSPNPYGNFQVNKCLNFIGNGIFRNGAVDVPFNNQDSRVGTISFVAGSDSSTVFGLSASRIEFTGVKNISIRSNDIRDVGFLSNSSGILVSENYIYGGVGGTGDKSSGQNITLKNNIVPASYNVKYLKNSDIRNNTFRYDAFYYNEACVFINNIVDVRNKTAIANIQ